jgi:hypothetical protein
VTATSDYLNRPLRSLDEVLRAREAEAVPPAPYNDAEDATTNETGHTDAPPLPNTAARARMGVVRRLCRWLGYYPT